MEFDRKKILTIATCEQAQVGQKGWFGDDAYTLRCKTLNEKPEELKYINDSSDLYPFGNENDCYAYFYPEESESVEAYASRQAEWVKENDINIGTKVRFTKGFAKNEDGAFCLEHLDAEGNIGIVCYIGRNNIVVRVAECNWYVPYIALEVMPTYSERQSKWVKDNDIKIGDKVRVVRKAEDYEDGWDNTWEYGMDTAIGKVYEVRKIKEGEGILLNSPRSPRCYSFPYFVLEKVKTSFRPFTSEELTQLVGKVVKLKAGESAGKRSLVTDVDCGKVVTGGNRFITAVNLLEYYVLDDGTPCGVEEE